MLDASLSSCYNHENWRIRSTHQANVARELALKTNNNTFFSCGRRLVPFRIWNGIQIIKTSMTTERATHTIYMMVISKPSTLKACKVGSGHTISRYVKVNAVGSGHLPIPIGCKWHAANIPKKCFHCSQGQYKNTKPFNRSTETDKLVRGYYEDFVSTVYSCDVWQEESKLRTQSDVATAYGHFE